uniref:Coiled-coil domain-containing protein 93 n=1 Tax=Cyprinus carpio TaxID=7962 RepID=A0A8C1PRP8_CYPCA
MAQVSEEEDLQAAEEVMRLIQFFFGILKRKKKIQFFTSCVVYSKLFLYKCVIGQMERSVEDRPERFGPVQQHRRQLASLNKQITQKTKELEEVIQSSLVGCQNQTIRGETGGPTYTEKLKRQLMSATHKETKQFFTLYYTLDDKKVYLEKEVNLLNSIHNLFQHKEQIVEGIKQSRIKMEKKRQENKMCRDQLNDEYLELLDKQRLYFKTVKNFKEECHKNEMLLSKLRAKGAS